MWKRVRDFLSLIADFLQVAGFLGWTPAALVGVIAVAGGWVTRVDIFWVIVATPVAVLATLAITQSFSPRLGTLPLSDGARVAYEQLRDPLWAEAAERMRVNGTPEGILDYLATTLTAEIDVYGRYPPSTKREKLDRRVVRSGSIEGGATYIELRDRHNTRIVDLIVRKADLRRAIKHMKDSTSEFSPE